MKHFKRLLPLFLAAVLLIGAALPIFADDDDGDGEELLRMAYNFYAGPDLSKTSYKFDSFMIDFRSDKATQTTYWSLANFGMDLSSRRTKQAYRNISGYGAYAGLQNTSNRVGILSFWEAAYRDGGADKKLTASRVYPEGSSTFGGEGEGTNCIMYYPWKDNQWYRMLLHSWIDDETGTTFAGSWYLDVTSGEWKLFAYFDTHLYDSYFIGGMSQFMENFAGGDPKTNCNVERTCQLKNMYVFDHEKKDWISLPTATLSYGDGGPQNEDQKKFGAHSFGATDEYFWGSTGGKVEDQEAYEKAATKYATYTITQPERPDLGAPAVKKMSFSGTGRFNWTMEGKSTPQLSYAIKFVDPDGKTVFEESASRPEVHFVKPGVTKDDAVKAILTIKDVFGAETTAEYMTDAYKAATGEREPTEPATEPASEPATAPATEPATEPATGPASDPGKDDGASKPSSFPWPIVAGCCAGAAVVIAVVAIVISKKKKK